MNSSTMDLTFCTKCAYNCNCGAIHVTYCRIEGCNHNHVFRVPAKQTCEVWKYDALIRLEEDRPIPLIRTTLDPLLNPQSPYGTTHGVMMNGGIQVWRYENMVSEIHPDGTVYKWYSPTHLLQSIATGDTTNAGFGSLMQVFPDGSFKGRTEALTYVWEPPVLRTMDETVPMVDLYQEVTLDYTRAPHPTSCDCSTCASSPVKPVYYHDEEVCMCNNCCDKQCEEYYEECSPRCRCHICRYNDDEEEDNSLSSLTIDSF